MKPGYPGGVVFSAPSTTIQEPPVPPARHHYDPVSPAVTSSQSGNFLPASLLVLRVMMMETKYLALQTTVTVRRAWPVPTTPSSPSTTTTSCPPPTTTTPSLSRTTLPCPQWRPLPVTPPGLRTWSTSLPRLPGPAGTQTTSRHLLQPSPLQWRLSWLSQVSEAAEQSIPYTSLNCFNQRTMRAQQPET